jgi:hypothetical protein
VKRHWRELRYWVWVWGRMPSEWKAGIGVLVVAGLLGGGWFAADRLTAAHAQVASTVLETTVRKLVTVRENGKVVQRVVPVIKQTRLKYSTRVLTTPGQLPPALSAASLRRASRS